MRNEMGNPELLLESCVTLRKIKNKTSLTGPNQHKIMFIQTLHYAEVEKRDQK